MTARIAFPFLGFLLLAGCAVAPPPEGDAGLQLAMLRPGVRTGFANAGWAYDRYSELPTLDAGTRMLVADLPGPGVIRAIHFTRHHPAELAARGVVLEIWFDDAEEPAVHCPLADFFGDGCNGSAECFTSPLIECAPWSYNAYFPMPFASRARIFLRNDLDRDLMDYSFVEWEALPEWGERLGYFHATYDRRGFQLKNDTRVTFLELEGAGHLVGRQYSVVTDEPLFRGFHVVMEGNNEVDVDGRERELDYLGTEDSFGFSWGFQGTFSGVRKGMALVEPDGPCRLSIHRFHDHLPTRFEESLRWSIDWSNERGFTDRADWKAAWERDGCWVDYATVHYWYQEDPGGYSHAPLSPPEQRRQALLRTSCRPLDVRDETANLSVDPDLRNAFDSPDDLDRVLLSSMFPDTHPFWIDRPADHGGHPGNPNPGRQGILAVHPRSSAEPCLVARRLELPAANPAKLRIVVSGDPYEAPGRSDFELRVGVIHGGEVSWWPEETIDAGDSPAEDHWRVLRYDLNEYAGETVTILVTASYGGPRSACMNEEAFFDEISVITE